VTLAKLNPSVLQYLNDYFAEPSRSRVVDANHYQRNYLVSPNPDQHDDSVIVSL